MFSFPITLVYWIVYTSNGSSGPFDVIVPRYLESRNIGRFIIISAATISLGFAELWDIIPYPFFFFVVSMMGVDVVDKVAIRMVEP